MILSSLKSMSFLLLTLLLSGCQVEYEHKVFRRQSELLKDGEITVYSTLVATDYGKMGNRSGPPWRLKLVVNGGNTDSFLVVRSAILKDGEEMVEVTTNTAKYAFANYSEQYPSEVNIQIDTPIEIAFEEGKEVDLELVLEITDGERDRTIKGIVRFIGVLRRGKAEFNPITDIT